jgi:hypothetical protein
MRETLTEKPWNQRTREEKRLTAPYALGWEEGHAAAYREFVVNRRVTPLTKTERDIVI